MTTLDPLKPRKRASPMASSSVPIRMPGRDAGRFHRHRGVFLLLLGALVVWMNITFLVPLVMGAIFATVLYPLMHRMARWRIGIGWKAGLVTFGFAISFLLPIGAIIFLGAEQALAKIQNMQASGLSADGALTPDAVVNMLGLKPLIARLDAISPISDAQVRVLGNRLATAIGAWGVKTLQNLLASLPGALFSTFIVLLTLFFLLIDGKKAIRFVRENSILGIRQTDALFTQAVSLCYSVVVASIAAGAVQAGLILLACVVTGTGGGVLIALVSFVLSFLPVLGTAPITIFLTLQALVKADYGAAIVFAVFVAIVGISDNIVRPYVLKGSASLHPLVGFVAAFGALDMIGFYGVFIGPVVAGLFFNLLPLVMRSYTSSTRETAGA